MLFSCDLFGEMINNHVCEISGFLRGGVKGKLDWWGLSAVSYVDPRSSSTVVSRQLLGQCSWGEPEPWWEPKIRVMWRCQRAVRELRYRSCLRWGIKWMGEHWLIILWWFILNVVDDDFNVFVKCPAKDLLLYAWKYRIMCVFWKIYCLWVFLVSVFGKEESLSIFCFPLHFVVS